MRVNIDRVVKGRRKNGVCRAAARTGPRCTKLARRATVRANLVAGARVSVKIPGRPGGSRLSPGTYQLTVIVTDPTGNQGNTRTILLTVRAPR